MARAEYQRRKDVRFVNPYTFVPISKRQAVERKTVESAFADRLHTGVLHCRLYVRTPLGIPDAGQVRPDPYVKDHKIYPFFTYMENERKIPVIPGSSLRGAIRSVFETATDSCFATLRDNTSLSKRVENTKAYKPGILKWEKEAWHLYQAERYLLAVDPGRNLAGNAGQQGRDDHYTKFEGLPAEAYVTIVQEGADGSRTARTQSGEELRFGDPVEFQPYTRGNARYVKRVREKEYLIWSGVATDVSKRQDRAGGKDRSEKGVVYIGETFAKKKHGENVFVAKAEEKRIPAEQLEKAYRSLLETLNSYRDPAINRNRKTGHSGYQDFAHAKRETGIPLWYSIEDKKLCLASIGRTFYNTTLNELAGERKPCTNRQQLCEACALFGMAGEESLGSRIRITDAKAEEGYTIEEKTLKILGQPRYSYLPFYARMGSGASGGFGNSNSSKIPESYDDSNVEIAGRKFYWHDRKAATDSSRYEASERNQMNSTMELVMPGAQFVFDLYYDGITSRQLRKIMWCIHLGENEENGNLCYKIGHGKPLGLGSVKLVIEENVERIFEDGSYSWKREKPVEEDEKPVFKKSRELKKVMDYRGPDEKLPIMYPFICDEQGKELSETGRNEDARHVWYQENKKKRVGFHGFGRDSDDSVESLPDIMKKDQALHAYQKIQGQAFRNHDRGNGRRGDQGNGWNGNRNNGRK